MELGALTKTCRTNSCYNRSWKKENTSTLRVTTGGRSSAWSFRPSDTYIGKGSCIISNSAKVDNVNDTWRKLYRMLNIIDAPRAPSNPVPNSGSNQYVPTFIFPIQTLNRDVWLSPLILLLGWQEISGWGTHEKEDWWQDHPVWAQFGVLGRSILQEDYLNVWRDLRPRHADE